MPVEDYDVHPLTKHDNPIAGCHSKNMTEDGYYVAVRQYTPSGEYYMKLQWVEHKMSRKCRQTLHLPECEGCTAEKDVEYIERWTK